MKAKRTRQLTLSLLAAVALFAAACGKPKIVIKNDVVTSWMTMSNEWVRQEANTSSVWHGVLFQLGTYDNLKPTQTTGEVGFGSITFYKGSNQVKLLKRDDFKWVNIVEEVEGAKPPILPAHAGYLYPDPNTSTPCDEVDLCSEECKDLSSCAENACFCPGGNCSTPPALITKGCLRLRRLHANLEPRGIITYWHSADGFKMLADLDHGDHKEFTFKLKRKVRIEIDGQQVFDFGEVDLIQINELGSPVDHGDHEDPPWEIGR